jgi:RNA polymerase sigma-70 factor (ECF subfamily)
MNIAELITEAKRGSAAAEKCLFDLFAQKMLMVCRRYVKNPEDAEERMLDGFQNFFRNIHSFSYQNDAAFAGWLKKIMVNQCLMFLRKKNVFTIVTESAAENISLDEDMLDRLSAVEIFNLLLQLPVGYRTVFNLYAIEGMPHGEIAAMMGISEGTSKSQLSKAKNLLQKMILNKGGEYARQQQQ